MKTTTPIEMLATEGADSAHWYRHVGEKVWLPSVSTILGTLKDGLEYVSAYDLRIASERGTKIHQATEHLEAGHVLQKQNFTAKEWDMLGGFIGWRNTCQLTTTASELRMANKKLGYAGTLDRIYVIGSGLALVDIKTTASIYPKAWLQVAAYAALAEKEGHKIMHTAILRLTDKSKAKYQWEFRDRTEWQKDLKAFNKVLDTWRYFNEGSQPKESDLPDELSLNPSDSGSGATLIVGGL